MADMIISVSVLQSFSFMLHKVNLFCLVVFFILLLGYKSSDRLQRFS